MTEERESLFAEVRRGYPPTRAGRNVLRLVLVVEVVLNVALLPAIVLWYGLHEAPGVVHDTFTGVGRKLRHGQIGPSRGIVW